MTSPLRDPATRDLGPSVLLPTGCIASSHLRALANALDRLMEFHTARGGAAKDEPCLVEVIVENERQIHARVQCGGKTYRLVLVDDAWEFK